VLRDVEMTDANSTNHKEAPCDAIVVMPGVVVPNFGILHVALRSRHHNRAS
jgi:hypothetical protein